MWKTLRLSLLVTLLIGVASTAWLDRARSVSWSQPLWVGILPIAADDSPATAAYIASLGAADFEPVAQFIQREGARRGFDRPLVHMELYPSPGKLPPARPARAGALSNVAWSLRVRWYAWRRTQELRGVPPHVRVFVLYHDPARTVKVPHSAGLRQGLIGVVHAFARDDEQGGNRIVIAHELLHTLGASDKYGVDDLPLYPDGYADPAQQPLLPQRRAELMAGRRAVSTTQAEMPGDLDEVVIGDASAREIRWLR